MAHALIITMTDSSFSHVALLVSSVEASAKILNTHKIETGEPETFEAEGTKEIYVGSYNTHRGLLLLLEAIAEGPYKRAYLKRGPSLHHIAIDVLNVESFIVKAQRAGWKLHPISAQSILNKTVWLYLEGIATLIEVNQKNELSEKATRVSKVELPIRIEDRPLFEEIGLGGLVMKSHELALTIDDQRFTFAQMSC